MEFKYPLAHGEGKEYTAEELYGKLSQEDSGYYLLSANGFWHGGVHFSNKQFSEEMPVQAIAEGTVIAYRINKNYPKTIESPYYKSCKYSTGFCLIKHTVPFTREKTAEEKQQEAQQQAAQKLADTKAQLEGKQIVVRNVNRNYRDKEGINELKVGKYLINAVLEVNSIGEAKDNYYFAKVKQIGVMDKEGNITNKKEDLIVGEHYIALLDKKGNIDNASSGKPAYELIPEQATKPATETTDTVTSASNTNTTAATTATNTDQTTAPATNTADATTAAVANVTPPLPMSINLEFYSLYMHLSAYEDYLPPKEEANKEASKEPEKPKQITVKAKLLRVRDKHRDETDSKVIGNISNGAKLEIIKTIESGQYTDVEAKLISGSVTGNKVKEGDTLWVPIKDGNKTYYTEDTTKTNVPKEKTRPSYWEGKVTAIVRSANGLTIWEKFEGGVLKTRLGEINQGSQFTFNSTEVKTIIHETQETLIAECTPIGTFNFRTNGEQPKGTFWTKVDKNSITRTKVEPLVFDTVVPCNTKIIAGEPLGYLGTYETPSKDGETKTKKQIHVEVFTPNLATVQFLLNNPFKLTGRKYIKVPKGTVLKGEAPIQSDIDFSKNIDLNIPTPGVPLPPKDYNFDLPNFGIPAVNKTAPQTNKPAATQSSVAPLSNTTTTSTATTETTSTQPTVAKIPDYTTTQDHYFAIDKLTIVNDGHIVETGTGKDKKITMVAGKEAYYEIGVEKHTGYLNKKGIEEIDQHEWAKLGFQLVQEANPKSDGYLDPKLMPAIFQQVYSKIDTNNDGKLQPEELKIALQDEEIRDQWSKLIAYHPSEWQLDTRSILARFAMLLTNPLAPPEKILQAQALLTHETQKMNTLTFLEQVVPPISPTPMLYHFHPVAFVEFMDGGPSVACRECGKSLVLEVSFLKTIAPAAKDKFLSDFSNLSRTLFPKYGIDTCSQVQHLLAQSFAETTILTKFRESLLYTERAYTPTSLYKDRHTVIDAGFKRLGMNNLTEAQKIEYVKDHLMSNDAGYANHCFGSNDYPNNDYRGRGLLHLTHPIAYKNCGKAIGLDIYANPKLVETDSTAIVETGLWFWKTNRLSIIANNKSISSDGAVKRITKIVNGAYSALDERIQFKTQITNEYIKHYGACIPGATSVIESGNEPSWLTIARQELATYTGLKEGTEPLASRVAEYHKHAKLGNMTSATPWCASFVYWCMTNAGYVNTTTAPARARMWGTVTGAWPEGEVYKSDKNGGKGQPYIGAIAVVGTSHVGFVVGKNASGNIILLGGNQSDQIKLSPFKLSGITCFMKPQSYTVPSDLEELPIIDLSGNTTYSETR